MYQPSIQEIESLLAVIADSKLFTPPYFGKLTSAMLHRIYNGIGPDNEPDCVARMLTDAFHWAAAAALIHDVRYEYGDGTKADWHNANEQFRANQDLLISAKHLQGLEILERQALHIEADSLFECVETNVAWNSYLAAVTRGPVFPRPT